LRTCRPTRPHAEPDPSKPVDTSGPEASPDANLVPAAAVELPQPSWQMPAVVLGSARSGSAEQSERGTVRWDDRALSRPVRRDYLGLSQSRGLGSSASLLPKSTDIGRDQRASVLRGLLQIRGFWGGTRLLNPPYKRAPLVSVIPATAVHAGKGGQAVLIGCAGIVADSGRYGHQNRLVPNGGLRHARRRGIRPPNAGHSPHEGPPRVFPARGRSRRAERARLARAWAGCMES